MRTTSRTTWALVTLLALGLAGCEKLVTDPVIGANTQQNVVATP